MRGRKRIVSSTPFEIPVRKPKRQPLIWWMVAALTTTVFLIAGLWWRATYSGQRQVSVETPVYSASKPVTIDPSQHSTIVESSPPVTMASEEALALIRQTNAAYNGPVGPIVMQTYRYSMVDSRGAKTAVFARVYLPATGYDLPIFGFGPGTTGIDDQCAPSLEVPAKRNFANYASHMTSYAANGYAAVVTDYEGMRDPSRLHHYMHGDLEGRSILDAVMALNQLGLTKNRVNLKKVILGGYSQGGHAALWADQLASSYTPSLSVQGVVGFGAVIDVAQTLTDTTRGANILWFGPYVLRSYQEWYRESYGVPTILKTPFAENLVSDVAKNCIDTNIAHWGNRDLTKVYTTQFIAAMRGNTLSSFVPSLSKRLDENLAGTVKTSAPKLLNHGRLDNVVLPSQSEAALTRMCAIGQVVSYVPYAEANHYTTMVRSQPDTLIWMKAILAGKTVPTSCR